MTARYRLVIPPVAVALAVLTACSTGSGGQQVATLGSRATTATTTAGDPADDLHKYYQCLQGQGVKISEPQDANGNSGGSAQNAEPGVDQRALREAMDKCAHFLANGGVPPTVNPQQAASLLDQARCLRAHGIDIPDPQPGQQQLAPVALPAGVSPDQFTTALQSCSQSTGGGR